MCRAGEDTEKPTPQDEEGRDEVEEPYRMDARLAAESYKAMGQSLPAHLVKRPVPETIVGTH